MATESNKERWIEQVLDSTQGMARAEAPAGMYDNVVAALNRPMVVKGVSLPVKQWAAAAVLLIVVNIASVLYFTGNNKQQSTTSNPIAAQMEQGATYNY